MMKFTRFSLFFTILLNISIFASEVSVKVKLSPAGSFNIEFKDVKGAITKKDDTIKSDKLSVKIKTLKTGMDLRDKHTKEKLEVKKYPYITVSNIVGKNGVGKGLIKIKNIEKKIVFKYKKIAGGMYMTKFPISLKDFNFTKINYMGVGVDEKVMVTAKFPAN